MHPRLDRILHYQQQPPQQQQQQQPIFMRRSPDTTPEQQDRVIVIIDDATLRAFVQRVYIIAAIFILVTSIIWLAISGAKCDVKKAMPVSYYLWLGLAIVLLMIMNFIPPARRIFPLNWALTIIIVTFKIILGAYFVGTVSVLIVLGAIAGAIAGVVFLYACGALCPQKLLPGVLITAVLGCILLIPLLVFMILMIFLDNAVIRLVFGILLLCSSILMIPFHAQSIHGRLQIVPILDLLYSSLTVFINFVMLLFAIWQLAFYKEKL